MFTGLVEATGKILNIEQLGQQARITIDIPFANELNLGDSVAVNGCCLTVAQLPEHGVAFDLLKQTLQVTSLKQLKTNDTVNLERALLPTQRLGGHFVQGHVDDIAEIIAIEPIGQDHQIQIKIKPHLTKYCIQKGSITIDGISLTIAQLKDNIAEFWITPHTFEHTNLKHLAPQQLVNIEVDLLAKYTEKLLSAHT